MRCEVCQDKRQIERRSPYIMFGDPAKDLYTIWFEPCRACGGQRITHCCDGEVAQPPCQVCGGEPVACGECGEG